MKISIENTRKGDVILTMMKKDSTSIFIHVYKEPKGDAFFAVYNKDDQNIANGYGKLDDVCSDVEKYIDEI